MTDTPEAVQRLYRTLLMRRSGHERLRMGCAMFDTARTFARASLQTSALNDAALRVQLFVRTYSGDFDPETVKRIVQWLSRPPEGSQGEPGE